MKKYIIVIEKAANNYSSFCPDVPGCVATGVSVEETVANMKEALEFHLEGMDRIPDDHSMTELQQSGAFDELSKDFFISGIELYLPETV